MLSVSSDFGSHDVRVPALYADLYLQGKGEYIIFVGGIGRNTPPEFESSEGDAFAKIAVELGVPKEKILVENKSTNTGENIKFAKELLDESGLDFKSFHLVHVPYMARRGLITFKYWFREASATMISLPVSLEEGPFGMILRDEMLNILVGEVRRLEIYPSKGYFGPVEIPSDVQSAYSELVEAGYSKYIS